MSALSWDTEQNPMLTPSEVLEHVFCPRFTWFMNVQHIEQHEDTRFKVLKGREVHQRRETENTRYLRRKIGVVKRETAVYLASSRLGLRGIVDDVLWLKDGTMAPLDYKYTQHRDAVFKTHRIQVLIYALLIKEVYQARVDRGYVAYIRGGSQLLEVPLDAGSIREITGLVDEIFGIITTGRLPRRTSSPARCQDCCYRNICV